MFRLLTIFASVCISCLLRAQEVTVVNHFGDTTGVNRDDSFVLSDVRTRTMVVNYYEPATAGQTNRAEQLIIGSLGLYVDHMIVLEGDKTVLKKNRKKMMADFDQIVHDALKYYEMKGSEKFKGFSARIDARLRQTENTEWKKTEFNDRKATENQRQKLLTAMLQKERSELKAMLAAETKNYAEDHLMALSGTAVKTINQAAAEAILKEIDSFSKNDPLAPAQLDFKNARVTLLASEDAFLLPNEAPKQAPADFETRVLALLERNNDRLDFLQQEIFTMKLETERDKIKMQNTRADDLQKQIDDLRALITGLATGTLTENGNNTSPATGHSTVTGVPASVVLVFDRGSTELTVSGQLMLNEIIDILARNPGRQIVVSGHADRTGDEALNLKLSRLRAERVKSYIAKSGISKERVILNFFGDNRSVGESPEDRKVVIEFVQ